MLSEDEQEELRNQINEVWSEFQRYQYEVLEPRFYKEKKGRRMELTHPWKTMKERIEAEAKGHALYWKYHRLYVSYVLETGERVPVALHYRKQETQNGDRYIRRTDL